jgi:hypothetical protein
MYTLTSSFILPILSIPFNKLQNNGFQNAYLGDSEIGEYGEHLVLVMDSNKMNFSNNFLQDHEYYEYSYHPDEDTYVALFSVPEHLKRNVIDPFIKGKFSMIDRVYVKLNFSPIVGGKPSRNWQILHKSPVLKAYWESELGCPLPEDAEVWSKPEIDKEFFNVNEENYGDTLECDPIEVSRTSGIKL